jgi:purine nucleoside phosphorylase
VLAVITGSGLSEVPGLGDPLTQTVPTPYGDAVVTSGVLAERPALFLRRHGPDHAVAPHLVNYRANVWALQQLGATAIVATAVSGAIAADLDPGSLVCIDQFIDLTSGRAGTFVEPGAPLRHVDMGEPYHPRLRAALVAAATGVGQRIRPRGTYVCTNGPRFETPAEITAFGRWGADLVGMTGCPEVALAAELGVPYAALGIISNRAAGQGPAISVTEITAVLDAVRPAVWAVVTEVARTVEVESWTPAS